MNTARNYVPKRSEDAVLLAQIVSTKDDAAFARVVRKYEDLVWNICCRVLHNRHDAEDAFQQTFLLLASKARRIRKPNSLSSWLYGVAFRTASSIRRQRQRDMLPYETMLDPNLAEDVLAFVARKNENELVSAEIMLMKEKHKTPLLMFYFMGDSTSQIATTLGITVSAVEGRLRQARLVLRSQLRLRGVDFDTTCAALVVPVFTMTPSLSIATLNNITAASASSIAATMTGYLTSLNQTGAKLMLSKLAVSFSIFCVATFGALHHGGAVQEDGPQVTQVESGEQPASDKVRIKFVHDVEEVIEVELLPPVHVHLDKMHDHVYEIWNSLPEIFFSDEEREQNVFVVENLKATAELTESKEIKLWITNDEYQWSVKPPTDIQNDADTEGQNRWTFDVQPKQNGVGGGGKFIVRKQVPLLSKIPYLGRLFKNIGNKPYRLEFLDETKEKLSEEKPLIEERLPEGVEEDN